MIGAALLTMAQLAAPAPDCQYDRAAMLALDEDAFDQDLSGGWRALSDKGCNLAAADLIRDYRAAHPGSPMTFLSFWHEGQLRAEEDQIREATALFARARKPLTADKAAAWNLYVDGSIAFLRHDRAALRTARDRLALLPKPEGLSDTVRWPMNLDVLDGLLRCFGKEYRFAYSRGCRVPG